MQKVEDIIKIVATEPVNEPFMDISKEKKALNIKINLELLQLVVCILVLLTLFIMKEFVPKVFSDFEKIYDEYIIEDAFVDESEITVINEE